MASFGVTTTLAGQWSGLPAARPVLETVTSRRGHGGRWERRENIAETASAAVAVVFLEFRVAVVTIARPEPSFHSKSAGSLSTIKVGCKSSCTLDQVRKACERAAGFFVSGSIDVQAGRSSSVAALIRKACVWCPEGIAVLSGKSTLLGIAEHLFRKCVVAFVVFLGLS